MLDPKGPCTYAACTVALRLPSTKNSLRPKHMESIRVLGTWTLGYCKVQSSRCRLRQSAKCSSELGGEQVGGLLLGQPYEQCKALSQYPTSQNLQPKSPSNNSGGCTPLDSLFCRCVGPVTLDTLVLATA